MTPDAGANPAVSPRPHPAATVEEARGKGAGAPAITTHPYLGILGVFLGTMTASLNGRLLSVGLADLRGALHLGFDEAAWIPTAFNAGTIFLGVFSVFLGAHYGVRRVLLVSAALYTLASLLVPLAGSDLSLMLLVTLTGLASGSFYSLTLTFVARNLPPKLLIFGIAAYALDVVVTSNIATLVQGLLAEHHSWRWIFWTPAVLSPLVFVCLYFGVPPVTAAARAAMPGPNWRGFFYMSLGLALIYATLDQGERLDWFASGTIAGLAAAGAFLVAVTLIRRMRQPNPLVNLPFLNARNIVILALGVFCVRFALLAPLVAIPGFLGNIRQYRAIQTGEALAWVAAPQFILVWLAAIAMVFIQPRIVMAAGFATIAFACALAARVDAGWAGSSFLLPELLLSVGIAAAFIGLVVSLLLLAMEMGAVTNVANLTTFAGCLHTMRLLGGEVDPCSWSATSPHANSSIPTCWAGMWMPATGSPPSAWRDSRRRSRPSLPEWRRHRPGRSSCLADRSGLKPIPSPSPTRST
ncbi:MAG: MFS transporter [Paludibaculum sp.]